MSDSGIEFNIDILTVLLFNFKINKIFLLTKLKLELIYEYSSARYLIF